MGRDAFRSWVRLRIAPAPARAFAGQGHAQKRIFEQGNFRQERLVLYSTHGTAGDGDDRQGNRARRGDTAGLLR
jgi:hypothetical protein